ncbi:MAG: ATP-binding protein, partial [Candidatus Dormiibacterota bacterium]
MSNPYRPRASLDPPLLAGREAQLRHLRSLIRQAPDTPLSLLVTGLRAVGKTVLLRQFAKLAHEMNWAVASVEVPIVGYGRFDVMEVVQHECSLAVSRARHPALHQPFIGQSPGTDGSTAIGQAVDLLRESGKAGLLVLVDDADRIHADAGS